MSVWTDPIIIPPLQIIIFIFGFLVNKIIDKKAGKNLTDLERLNYVGDRLVDTSVMHGKKAKGVIKSIMSEDEVKNSETIPSIQQQINDIALVDGQALADMQLTIDNLQHKLLKILPDLDLSNGETEDNVG